MISIIALLVALAAAGGIGFEIAAARYRRALPAAYQTMRDQLGDELSELIDRVKNREDGTK